MARSEFNDAYITSRYKAWDKDGNYKGVVTLTNDRKRKYEERGFTFIRTNLREMGVERYGSGYQ
jgi:hypothetical protein